MDNTASDTFGELSEVGFPGGRKIMGETFGGDFIKI
jgi:hypothetical protein